MQINLTEYDPVGCAPSLRLSFDASRQCHSVHKDFHGEHGTLVRVCLLELRERDMVLSGLLLACYQDLSRLSVLNRTGHEGCIWIRHNDAANTLLMRMGEILHDSPGPIPQRPYLPE